MTTRIEKDMLGQMEIPAEAYYGSQTARAVLNFPISGLRPHWAFTWAVIIIKMCAAKANMANDLRLLVSGPRTGLDEIRLPPVQPGSSIMPGKINPSMAEMIDRVCFQVMGCDHSTLRNRACR